MSQRHHPETRSPRTGGGARFVPADDEGGGDGEGRTPAPRPGGPRGARGADRQLSARATPDELAVAAECSGSRASANRCPPSARRCAAAAGAPRRGRRQSTARAEAPDVGIGHAPHSTAPGSAHCAYPEGVMAPDHTRASDRDRERAANRLRAAAAQGRLSVDELEERVGTAYGAVSRAELQRLTRDLPE